MTKQTSAARIRELEEERARIVEAVQRVYAMRWCEERTYPTIMALARLVGIEGVAPHNPRWEEALPHPTAPSAAKE